MSTSILRSTTYDEPLRVAMVSKAMVTGIYQRKAEELANLGVELTVFMPPFWRDRRGAQPAEALFTSGYTLRTLPCRFVGSYHLHYYPTLARRLAQLRPHILHMDEEPYNLATWHALLAAQRLDIGGLFFTWQNINRRYPPPFLQMERWVYANTPLAIAGNWEAGGVMRAKGYDGEIAVIPQFGIDPGLFAPDDHIPHAGVLRIGYAGALVAEKGIDLLLDGCRTLSGEWQLTLAGEGEEQHNLAQHAAALGIADRVTFVGRIAGEAMPAFYRNLDVLVLPSRTTPTWKEQFGRVLTEAMACGVVVVGSDSGEIPRVIDHAGVVFPEGDAEALGNALRQLQESPDLRAELAVRGRERVLDRFTMHSIALQTRNAYRKVLELRQQG